MGIADLGQLARKEVHIQLETCNMGVGIDPSNGEVILQFMDPANQLNPTLVLHISSAMGAMMLVSAMIQAGSPQQRS